MLYEVRVAANKGLGLFAKYPIPRGTRIIAEKPLVALRPGERPSDILSHARRLDGKSRERLLELSWHPGNGIKRLGRWYEALNWIVKHRVAPTKIAQPSKDDKVTKSSAIVFGRTSQLVRDLSEAFRILSIFRSNSFNLASSENAPSHQASLKSNGSSTSLEVARGTRKESIATFPSPSPAYELALFPEIARINHSCIPNAQANYHPLHRTFNVHATRDISAGEEVSINYLPEHGQLRDQRVSKLADGYGFMCDCAACNLGTKEGERGEQNRKTMQDRMKKTKALFADSTEATQIADAGYGADGMPESLPSTISDQEQQQINAFRNLPEKEREIQFRDRELEALNEMLLMYRKEGIAGREVASLHYHIAQLQRSSGAYKEAETTAKAGMELEEACLGKDHPGCLQALALVESIREDAAHAKVVSID